jgi:citrate lyase subunit alpha / citrate CoA-transferase
MTAEMTTNAAGRPVPTEVNGVPMTPYQGVGGHLPAGRLAAPPVRSAVDYPADGDKRLAGGLRALLERAALPDGARISTHHHYRNGDLLACALFDAAAELGLRDLVWCPSSVFPCHLPIVEHARRGVVRRIEAGINGPVGDWISLGGMRDVGIWRSHGVRTQSIREGELHVDLAVIAASASDPFGNANGLLGPHPCGPLGFAHADARFADRVAVVTDHIVPFPCLPADIRGKQVDWVVTVDQVGDPANIVFGTTRIATDPLRLRIAELAARFARVSGLLRDGWSFQAGASSIALAITDFLARGMREDAVRARFIQAGSTRQTADLLREGLTDHILEGQSFDIDGAASLRDDPRHVQTTPFDSYDFHGKGDFMPWIDAVFLGATEVDRGFNANVVTHSDGRALHGLGGWPHCLTAGCTILTVPSARRRGAVLVDRVTTLCGPGELIDVVVTERGIAVNPRRRDLLDAVAGSDLPIRSLEELRAAAEAESGVHPAPELGDEVVAVVKWVDGTLIDAVRRVV